MKKNVFTLWFMILLLLMLPQTVWGEVYTAEEIPSVHKSVYVAGNPNNYPLEYYDTKTKTYAGILPEVLKQVSAKTGIDFTYLHDGKHTQEELAQNLQVEMVSAYHTSAEDTYAADKVTVFSYQLDTGQVPIGFAFTSIADETLITTVKSAIADVSVEDIYGYFVQNETKKPANHIGLLLLAILCCVLLGVGVLLFGIRIRYMKMQSKRSKLTDPETGIGNLIYFEQKFNHLISDFSRRLYYIAYITIDSNYLQAYHGEATFTDIIKYTAGVLSGFENQNEFSARITENGFALAFQCSNNEEAETQIYTLMDRLNRYINIGEENTRPVFYASVYNLDGGDRNCEIVLFNLRRNCSKMFETEEQVMFCDVHSMHSLQEEKKMVELINQGFANQEFKLYLQFIVDNQTKKIVGAEALSRWDNPDRGVLSPVKYIEIMSATGLISKLDFYMFEQVCRQLEKWHGTELGELTISCNFTRITLSEDDFVDKIQNIFSKYSFDKSKLTIEITEEVMEKNREKAMNNVRACKNMGFGIALDDMGSGYTSLINLCDYPIDVVKLDRTILLKTDKKNGRELFVGMIALAHSLHLNVICEGVETEEQDMLVSATACDRVQGWYYSRVFPVEEGEDYFKQYTGELLAKNAKQ